MPLPAPGVELVVTLKAPPLARASLRGRSFQRAGRLALRAPASVSYLRELTRDQDALVTRIHSAVPSATVHWRYSVVLNGLAVVAPAEAAGRIAALPGVAHVYRGVRYRRSLFRSPAVIGAPTVWGPTLATAGDGIKIGVIDDGIEQSHPFLSPAGFTMPAGYPKGNRAFTTAKVIVARSFPPPGATGRYARLPFDPNESEHGTHVAGIAAGDHDTTAPGPNGPVKVSGIAPRAYLGNYRVLTIPTGAFGLDGNSPEIVAGIERAVLDGMNVINLSLGEPEITPSRDIVVQAIDAAADAGVVPVIAAGNDFDVLGPGSIDSPGSASKAITAAAATKSGLIAEFSSGGPAPVSLRLKPDVTAPGVGVLSSVPDPRRLVAVLRRHEHGRAAHRRGCSTAAPAAPNVDRGADQVGADAHRQPGQGQHPRARRDAADPRRRRNDLAPASGPAAHLREAVEPLVRAAAPRPRGLAAHRAHGCRRRCRRLDGHRPAGDAFTRSRAHH